VVEVEVEVVRVVVATLLFFCSLAMIRVDDDDDDDMMMMMMMMMIIFHPLIQAASTCLSPRNDSTGQAMDRTDEQQVLGAVYYPFIQTHTPNTCRYPPKAYQFLFVVFFSFKLIRLAFAFAVVNY